MLEKPNTKACRTPFPVTELCQTNQHSKRSFFYIHKNNRRKIITLYARPSTVPLVSQIWDKLIVTKQCVLLSVAYALINRSLRGDNQGSYSRELESQGEVSGYIQFLWRMVPTSVVIHVGSISRVRRTTCNELRRLNQSSTFRKGELLNRLCVNPHFVELHLYDTPRCPQLPWSPHLQTNTCSAKRRSRLHLEYD